MLPRSPSARVLANSRTLSPLASALRDVVDWLVDRYALQFEDRGVLLQARAPDGPAMVAIDTLVLRQVAENLVTNAMKYAPESDLDITCRPGAPGYWQLVLEDRGPGIPPSRQRELFKPFVRMHEGGNPEIDSNSTGLGLSLAKQIIANAGGQLWYEDREGGGSRFVLELAERKH